MSCWAAGKKMGVSIWNAVHLHSMDRWVLSGADVQAPWHGVLETVWLHWDEAQQVWCLRGRKIVRWCRTQASSHSSQGVVGCRINEARVSTAEPARSAILLLLNGPGLRWLVAALLPQHHTPIQRAASKVQRMKWTSCEVTRGVVGTWVSCPTFLRGIWARTKRTGFCCCGWLSAHVVPSFLLRWKTTNTNFVVLSLNFQVWWYSPMVAMSLLCTPSTVCQSLSACMNARSSAFAYFLETVVGRSDVDDGEKGCQDGSLWDAILQVS